MSTSQNLDRAQKLSRVLDGSLITMATVVAGRSLGLRDAALVTLSALVVWWATSRVVRQYDTTNGRGFVGDLALTCVMLTTVLAALAIVAAFVHHASMIWDVAVLSSMPVMLLARFALIGRRLRSSQPTESVVVVGVGAFGRLTGKEIGEGGRHLIGYLRFDDESATARLHEPVLGCVSELEEMLKTHVVDEVYLASTAGEHAPDVQAAIQTCERLGVPFALPVCMYRLTRAHAVDVASADSYAHFLNVQHKPLQVGLKRLFDIVASGFALAVLSPLLIGVALAVKLTSSGPVLFRQQRVGLLGRRFEMLKFRSMIADAEALKAKLMSQNEQSGPAFKIKRDPRITAVGRFIRKFSIDELPQLVNVLRGDMSIVGPRPPLSTEVSQYEAWQRRRLSVRPGLTCVWQVSGRNQIGFRDWMLLDMQYIDHWSLARDFQLILRTFPVVLTGRGAS